MCPPIVNANRSCRYARASAVIPIRAWVMHIWAFCRPAHGSAAKIRWSACWLKTRAGGRVGLTAVGGWLRWEVAFVAGISLLCNRHVAESCRAVGWRVVPSGARMGHGARMDEDPATGRASGRGCCFVRVCAAGGRLRRPRSPGTVGEPSAGRAAAGHLCRRLAAGRAASGRAELTAAGGGLGGSGIGDPQSRHRPWVALPPGGEGGGAHLRRWAVSGLHPADPADPRRRPGAGQLRDHRPGRRRPPPLPLPPLPPPPRSTAPAACCAASPATRSGACGRRTA